MIDNRRKEKEKERKDRKRQGDSVVKMKLQKRFSHHKSL